MKTRTWPYGTQLTATVLSCTDEPGNVRILMVMTEDEEPFVLVNGVDSAPLDPDTPVTMEFRQGGPTGGFWEVVRRPIVTGHRPLFIGDENIRDWDLTLERAVRDPKATEISREWAELQRTSPKHLEHYYASMWLGEALEIKGHSMHFIATVVNSLHGRVMKGFRSWDEALRLEAAAGEAMREIREERRRL